MPVQEDPGGLAQLGEHLLCKQGVVGSIPSSSTKKKAPEGAIIFGSAHESSIQKQSCKDCFCIDRSSINRLFFKNS